MLKQRGLHVPPKLVIGDGAPGFWAALEKIYRKTRAQRNRPIQAVLFPATRSGYRVISLNNHETPRCHSRNGSTSTAAAKEWSRLLAKYEAGDTTQQDFCAEHGLTYSNFCRSRTEIFIVWDRLFGTFEEEQETAEYGIVTPINSVNPFVVWFHGLVRLSEKLKSARSIAVVLGCLLMPPEWVPNNYRARANSVKTTANRW